jgi:hypothetical protein
MYPYGLLPVWRAPMKFGGESSVGHAVRFS